MRSLKIGTMPASFLMLNGLDKPINLNVPFLMGSGHN